MNDVTLFQTLARRVPLEPITDAERYYKACDVQDELRENNELVVQLYIKTLSLFVEAYEGGYRAD